MIVSILTLLYLGMQTYKGFMVGFTRKIVNLILSAIIFVIAIIFQNPLGTFLFTQFTGQTQLNTAANIATVNQGELIAYKFAAFFIIFFVGRFIIKIFKRWIPEKKRDQSFSSILDSVLGAIISFFAAYFFAFVVLSMLNAMQFPWFMQQTINSPFIRFIIYNTPGLSNGIFNSIFSISRTAG